VERLVLRMPATLGFLVGLSAFTAQGEQLLEVTCFQGSMMRTVQITYWEERGRPLCKVMYRKPTEPLSYMQVIWAGRDVGDVCEQKAVAFLDELRSWGWSCDRP
jgi:hypothetical protein